MMSDTGGVRRLSSSSGTSSSSSSLVRPQPVTESSLLDSVAGFITEVQALNKPNHDAKVQVTWASFQKADVNDPALFPESAEINGNFPPLILTLGYSQGVQVWLIPMTGEAHEVLAWKHGQVKTLRVLSTPENCFGYPDNYAHCRPLVVMADSTGPGLPFSSASFMSLKSGEVVHNIKFNSEIADIVANRRVVITSFREKLAAFDACNLEARFTVTTCYPSPGVHVNPVALGDRWLAYADQRYVGIHRSLGGMETDGSQSVAAWGINVGSKLAQGMSKIYSNIFSSGPSSSTITSSARSSHHHQATSGNPSSPTASGTSAQNQPQKGVVTVLDIVRVYKSDRDEVNITDKISGVVAHFIAHNKAVVAMEFDLNGTLLLTCDRVGNHFNLYRIVPHPAGSCYSSVHHLYSLYRGDTPGSVQDIAFSPDSRWVAVSTLRGTTHIFPITPYGGGVGVRTHTSPRVVNRLSRFHRSAGLDEHRPAGPTNSSGRSSPNPTLGSSPVFSKMAVDNMDKMPLVIPFPNPYVPPFPSPTLVQPLAQLRQPYIVTLTNQTLGTAASGVVGATGRKPKASGSSSGNATSLDDIPIRLAVAFAPSRAWLVGGAQNNIFNRQPRSKMADALYVMANHGVLLEYTLDPIPESTLPKEKICESSPIELQISAYGQWTLTPPRDRNELQPPLLHDNPLMIPLDQMFGEGKKDPFGAHETHSVEEDKWLSQVEIVTHVGPHRRLWMGPQFCFKTLRPAEHGGEEALDLDIACRPEQSNPVNMPSTMRQGTQGSVPVLIEAGSASSFELSPRFANHLRDRLGSREHVHQDVESELQEAMSETVIGEDSLLDGATTAPAAAPAPAPRKPTTTTRGSTSFKPPARGESSSAEEEFFCLTPEDARSLGSSGRSRNASATSGKVPANFPVHMGLPDTKIFSVAVEARPSEQTGTDVMVVCDVDTDYTGRFAVVSSSSCYVKKKHEDVEQTTTKVVKEDTNNKGSCRRGKNKKKKGGSSASGSNVTDESKSNMKSSEVKETQCNEEEEEEEVVLLSLPTKEQETEIREKLLAEALQSTTTMDEDACNIAVLTNPPTLLCADDEFVEMSRAEDNNDEPFVIKEDMDCGEEEEEEPIVNINTETTARPYDVSECYEDFFGGRKDNDIVKGIELANKLYSDEDDDKRHNLLDFGTSTPAASANKSNNNNHVVADSSEDDIEFQPAVGKKKRKNKKSNNSNKEEDTPGSSFADSESSLMDEHCKGQQQPEGWSFEADDLDVNKLLDEAAARRPEPEQEKARLEDVFKFDSELVAANDDDDDHHGDDEFNMDEVKEALNKEATTTTTDESESEQQTATAKVMSTSLNVTFDETSIANSTGSGSLGNATSLSKSLVCSGPAGSTSESSVGNSPNPKKNKGKSKKKKKR